MTATTAVVALMTVHNRRDITEACLRSLDVAAGIAGVALRRVIVDDGSTDGTAELLEDLRRDDDVFVRGPGDLFWAGGMRRGFAELERLAQFDHLLLLNDDAVLYPSGLQTLLSTAAGRTDSLIVGQFVDPDSQLPTYGGYRRRSTSRPLTFVPVHEPGARVVAMNANAVLVGKEAHLRLHGFSTTFTHSLADFDYALRATRSGLPVLLSHEVVGECPRNRVTGSWQDRSLSRSVRLRKMRSPKGLPPRQWAAFCWRHARLAGVPYILSPWVSVLRGGGSAARLSNFRNRHLTPRHKS